MILRCSSAPRWMTCKASEHFPQPRPDQETDPAREGTCAAWVAELVRNGDAAHADDMLGETHENGWVVDEDMVRHVQAYLEVVCKRTKGRAEVFRKHPTLSLQGTSDDEAWNDDGTILYITDLKYGYGIVEPISWQLVAYMVLALRNMSHSDWPERIVLSIYQPRAMHAQGVYRKRVIDIHEAVELMVRMEDHIVDLQRDEHPLAVAGPHCDHCTKAVGCVALTRSVYDLWEPVQSREYMTPTPAQLSEELIMLELMSDLFEARHQAIKAEVDVLMDEGVFIPNWGHEKRYGKKAFTVDATMIRLMTGIDPVSDKLVTPAELIRRGKKKDVDLTEMVKTISKTPMIGTKLVRVDSSTIAQRFAAAKVGAK